MDAAMGQMRRLEFRSTAFWSEMFTTFHSLPNIETACAGALGAESS
jgi:hypothetical protein